MKRSTLNKFSIAKTMIMRYKPVLSKKTKDKLKKSGWFEHRKIDITHTKEDLQKKGFSVSPENEIFLSSFMNLELVYSDGQCLYEFRILDYTKKHFDKFVSIIGEEFIPIGTMRNFYIDLLLAKDNSMYAATDHDIFFLSETLDESINFICESSLKSNLNLKPL